MLVKMYWTVWAAIALTAAIFSVAGYFTAVVGVAFGFVAFGVVFMGMIGVLPFMVSHPAPSKVAAVPALQNSPMETPAPSKAFAGGVLKST